MSVFTPSELDVMISGVPESLTNWTVQDLMENTTFGKGFSVHQHIVQDFFAVLTELTLEERRMFLIFLTGCPRLPVGGIFNCPLLLHFR